MDAMRSQFLGLNARIVSGMEVLTWGVNACVLWWRSSALQEDGMMTGKGDAMPWWSVEAAMG